MTGSNSKFDTVQIRSVSYCYGVRALAKGFIRSAGYHGTHGVSLKRVMSRTTDLTKSRSHRSADPFPTLTETSRQCSVHITAGRWRDSRTSPWVASTYRSEPIPTPREGRCGAMLLSSPGGITIQGVEDTHYVAVLDGPRRIREAVVRRGTVRCGLNSEGRRRRNRIRWTRTSAHRCLLKAIPASF